MLLLMRAWRGAAAGAAAALLPPPLRPLALLAAATQGGRSAGCGGLRWKRLWARAVTSLALLAICRGERRARVQAFRQQQ